MKTCTGCGRELPIENFNRRPNGRHGISARCRDCTSKYARGIYSKNRLKIHLRQKIWRENNRSYDTHRKAKWYKETRPERLERMAVWKYKTRRAALTALGGKCACCGEQRETMLDIDHINNDGAQHRTTAKGGNFLVYRQIAANPDRSVLQVLCCNCNQSKRRNGGACEHTTEPVIEAFGWCAS